MTYEYENAMGYLQPAPARVVEVYGTMPEAQEYVQEEFNLPYLPPAHALQPPMNPRTDPYRRGTILPIEPAMGSNQTVPSFFERNKGWLVPVGVIAGGYFIAKALGLLGERGLLANPPIKDVKLQEAGPTGYIPAKRGELKPFDPSKLRPPRRYKTTQAYVDACLQINPDALEVKKLPADLYTYGEGAQEVRQEAIKNTEASYLRILKVGYNKFAPEDWVGKPGLYFRFRDFALLNAHFVGDGRLRNVLILSNALKFWTLLGMPAISGMTKKGKATIRRFFKSRQFQQIRPADGGYYMRAVRSESTKGRAGALIKKLDRLEEMVPGLITPRAVWQLCNIGNDVVLIKLDDLRELLVLLEQTPVQDQWRIRWYTQYFIKAVMKEATVEERKQFFKEGIHIAIPEEFLEEMMALSEKDFIKHYSTGRGGGDSAWARLYGRLPEIHQLRGRTPQEIADLPMKAFLRAMRSKELVGYVEDETENSKRQWINELRDDVERGQESINSLLEELAYKKDAISRSRDAIKALKKRRKETFRVIKDLEVNEDQWLRKIGEDGYERYLKAAYKDYKNSFTEMMQYNNLIRRHKRSIKGQRERISHKKSMISYRSKLLEEAIRDSGPRTDFDQEDFIHNKVQAAIGLSVVFGQNWRGWLKRMERRGFNLHDATYWLPTVESPGLGDYLTKYWQAPAESLVKISRGWNGLTEEEKTLRPRELVPVIVAKKYKDAHSQKLATEAARWGVPEERYSVIEGVWLGILHDFNPKLLPQVDIRDGEYRMYRLERDDPRALFLGEHSACCQSIEGVGKDCVFSGLEDDNSGFYVIEDNEGDIVAQSWAWINGNYLVFDSIEGKGIWHSPDRNRIIARMYTRAAEQILEHTPTLHQVRVGSSAVKEEDWSVAEDTINTPESYGDKYSDARGMQQILASREDA